MHILWAYRTILNCEFHTLYSSRPLDLSTTRLLDFKTSQHQYTPSLYTQPVFHCFTLPLFHVLVTTKAGGLLIPGKALPLSARSSTALGVVTALTTRFPQAPSTHNPQSFQVSSFLVPYIIPNNPVIIQ